MYNEELTYEQKVALEAEVAGMVSTSVHDGELLRRIYWSLKEVPSKYYEYVLECFQKLTTLPQEDFMKIRYEIQMGTIPIWIWIKKTILDIKATLRLTNQEGVLELSADKLELKKKIIESAFILFCRKVTVRSTKLTKDLCNAILDDKELDFLETACNNIILFVQEFEEEREEDKEFLDKILDLELDIRETLSFKLELGDEDDDDDEKKPEPNIFKELLEDLLSTTETKKKVEANREHRKEVLKQMKAKSKSPYKVMKVYKGSGQTTNIRTFSTKKEAVEFIKKIKEDFPDIFNTCSFCIEHEVG